MYAHSLGRRTKGFRSGCGVNKKVEVTEFAAEKFLKHRQKHPVKFIILLNMYIVGYKSQMPRKKEPT